MKNFFKSSRLIFFFIVLISSCTNEFDYGSIENAVKTIDFTNITQTTATVSGLVITDNGENLTERGICYGTVNYPTIANSKKINETAVLGDYECILDNLSPSTTYFARAYATNSYGTAYGQPITFTTLVATVPILSTTSSASLVTATTARTGGVISHTGASSVTSRGVCYSNSNSTPTIANARTIDGTGIGTFISSLTGLATNTTYYIRAYATNGSGTGYGDIKTFTTTSATIPQGIITSAASNITLTSASSGGNITNDGGATIISRGVCWSNTNTIPTIANSNSINGTGIGAFSSSLTNLLPGTTYYVRAYATNNVGTSYGNVISFTTIAASIPQGITTTAASTITQTSASSGGNITNDGGATVTSRGVCWSNTITIPTIANSSSINGTGIGSFSSSLTNLLPGTTYYVRAYASNIAGTAYGNVITFRTASVIIPQGITTTAASIITQTSASSGGNITNDGGATITSRGVCWSNTITNPTIANSISINGTGIGAFSSSLANLLPATTYYVRAYATNSAGTAYGNTISFTTLPNLSVGQSYQGGIIAYIFVQGDNGWVSGQTHGIIVTNSNQSTGSQWGCSGTSINGTTIALSAGITNTTAIVSGCVNSNIAAAICNNLTFGGYTDWCLPSFNDLNKLYTNRTIIGGFAATSYWSSSQSSSTAAYSINFSSGLTSNSSSKNSLMYVRAIRYF